ncbi:MULTISPECIES: ABC transporter ATP-binding protein [Paracoccus]|jgi:multiple sugar transport system ATP-binding protein|uniref:Carbohydrate ABC transporter ATP-binding protein, CUT1 family n=1 Tax=Paracoccus denitrificans (strain Pd 1222) TaxID=318586 RepID=A1B4W2_PARDP|nr:MULTISPECIES: ATP-binding cassette domain-containing protein [Paracoccus]ABL70556.1 carbohydrate ABC transporter ATP-binding protein, CUT1 family [Paracoccus denitrificans PD1222]MBB4627439.1 multiple sugar transport system ATP-binding protein [Paracoccus denitrificans]MCU7429408.1 ATP-binding cassette domain-containing protein [Paracoccus denitrificans]MDK8873714.1 ATP-binding cassette domain-containing protein [Paracoccus sp. SSJ]QAR25890.1 ATP-binding cassette domain-containing protein [
MGALTLNQVTKSFGTTQVIKGVDLNVEDGEFCVFVGPSGCGKSTLLRMIAGLEDVTSGDVTIDGARVNDLAPARREIAMVFQSYALYPHLTVRDNMGLALKQAGTPRAQILQATEKAAEMLALAHLLERRPAELSGGQRQRVAIGRAIVRRPKLFLFDEPLSNLDAALRVQTRIEIARLHRELGATMIYVTHDQVEAMTLADKIVVLRGGVVEQVGRPMDLYNDPDNTFVAGFIGSPQMNFLDAGKLGLRSDRLGIRPEHLVPGGGQISGRVSHVEKLGGETLVYLSSDDHGLLTVRLFGEQDYAVDEVVGLGFEPNRAFHFDAEGRRLR